MPKPSRIHSLDLESLTPRTLVKKRAACLLKMDDLRQEVAAYERQLDRIQQSCPHQRVEIDPGTDRIVCKRCQALIGERMGSR